MENPNQSVEIWDQCRKFFSVASDMELYSQGQFLLQHFDRDKVIEQIQNLIQKYEPEINMLGSFENRHVVQNVDFDQKSDIEIQGDLVYLNSHLPLYAFLHAGHEVVFKRICKEQVISILVPISIRELSRSAGARCRKDTKKFMVILFL